MNNLKVKYWNIQEEEQLIDEINQLLDINKILENHNRKITGITMRIEKIINDPEKSSKIKNKNEIILKYLNESKNKFVIDYNELYSNILKYNSIDEISTNYNNISTNKIKNILNNYLNKDELDLSKKLRIKCLLKSKDDLEFAEKIYNNDNNDNNINSIIISLLSEIKFMNTELFDIKNRVKIIMKKVECFEKHLINDDTKKKCKKIKIIKELEEYDQINLNNLEEDKLLEDNLNIEKHKKENKNKNTKIKKNKINKQVEQIILSKENNYTNNNYDDEELEKELEKYLK